MHVVAVATQKGGAGKTTTTSHLAVALAQAGNQVAIVDTDPQPCLAKWWDARIADDITLCAPDLDNLKATIKGLGNQGYDYLIIDTPPKITADILAVIKMADLVLVPVKPGPHDLRSVGDTIALIKHARRHFAFVVNDAKPNTKMTMSCVLALQEHGAVVPGILHSRMDFVSSQVDGRTAQELSSKSRAAAEVKVLCEYVVTQLRKHGDK